MSDKSGIGWTDATWNCVTGCDLVSPGCAHCYAREWSGRMKAMGNRRYQNDGKPPTSGPGFGVTLHEDLIDRPIRWKKPRRIFVNSMSDMFHEEVPFEFIDRMFMTMNAAPQHTYQILTKRPARMLEYFASKGDWPPRGPRPTWPWNIWLGVSVESQYWAERRIPLLLKTPAKVKFLSVEPLLSPVDLQAWLQPAINACQTNLKTEADFAAFGELMHAAVRMMGIGWVIVGGESGRERRECDPAWIGALVEQCLDARVPIYVKQDAGLRPGMQGRLSAAVWSHKEYPQLQEVSR